MFTNGMIALATNIVKHLDLPENLGCTGDSCEFDDSELHNQLARFYPGDFHIDYGISKVVLIFPNLPFVIKIPFSGMHWYEYEYNEEEDEYEETDYYFYPFEIHPDYCEHEMNLVEIAQDRGFGQFVLDTLCFFEDAHGRKFYMQEKAQAARELGFCSPKEVSEYSRTTAALMKGLYCRCNEQWRACVVEYYGENMWTTFVNWDDLEGFGILKDMHAGNYGYRMDGTPVLIDISGFEDD